MPFVRRHSTGMFLSTNSQHFTVGQTAGEKKTKQFHIQQCLLRYPRSQSKRSILVLPLQTKMDIQESFAKTMICTQANTGAHHMVCGSTQAKKTVYTRLCFSPFFCQTWRRLFGTLLAPSFCNASAIDYIKSNASMQSTSSKSQTKHQICLFSFFGTISVPMLLLLCSAPMSLIWEVDVLLAPTDNTRKMESNTAEKQNNFGVEICNKSWTRFAS